MDPKRISVCENPSGSVHEADIVVEVKGQPSDSVSKKVLIEQEEEEVNNPQHGEENGLRMAKDGVRYSNVSSHAVHEELVVDSVTAVSCCEAESDPSKVKVKEFHMVDLNCGGEKICRICHFGSDQSPEAAADRVSGESISPDLIEIGCKCKNELGLAHFHCAEAWFKLKGNNVCEICGCAAKNVTVSMMEEWCEVRDNTLDERRRRRRGHACCIFMVFLFTILLLHWFFKKITGYYRNT